MLRVFDSNDDEWVRHQVEFGDSALAPDRASEWEGDHPRKMHQELPAFDRAHFLSVQLAEGLRQVDQLFEECPELDF